MTPALRQLLTLELTRCPDRSDNLRCTGKRLMRGRLRAVGLNELPDGRMRLFQPQQTFDRDVFIYCFPMNTDSPANQAPFFSLLRRGLP